MTAGDTHFSITLPDEAVPLVWRILGVGESPFRPSLDRKLVEAWVRNHISHGNQDTTIEEIQSWFDRGGEPWALRGGLRVPVAMLILHGVKRDINDVAKSLGDDIAFWAIGSIHPEVAEAIIRSQWSSDEVRTVVNYALETLDQLCQRNRVINPDRIARLGAPGAEVTVDVTQKQDKLETFHRTGQSRLNEIFRNVLMSNDPFKVMEAGRHGTTTQGNHSRAFRRVGRSPSGTHPTPQTGGHPGHRHLRHHLRR